MKNFEQVGRFDIKQTNIAKGIAVLMLLWHHLFYNNPNTYNRYFSLYKISGGVPIEAYLAVFCKICVAIFVFLSGYGLYFSYIKIQNKSIKNDIKFIISKLLKLMSSYWYIFIIFVLLGFVFERNPIKIYDGNILYFFIDFFGLSDLLFGSNKYTMNATWWYMSLAIILYIIYPIIYRLCKRFSILVLVASIGLTFVNVSFDNPSIRIYLLLFVLGAIFAQYDLFAKINKICNKQPFIFGVLSFLLFAISVVIRQLLFFQNNKFDGILCIPIILFGYLVISKIKIVDKIFEQLGKYSGSIFMFHTFIYSYYFKDFIYSFKYTVLIFTVLTAICYLVAVVLEWVKNLIGYNKLFDLIIKKVNGFCIKENV